MILYPIFMPFFTPAMGSRRTAFNLMPSQTVLLSISLREPAKPSASLRRFKGANVRAGRRTDRQSPSTQAAHG